MTTARVLLVSTMTGLLLASAPRAARAEQPVLVLQFSGEPAQRAAALSKEMAQAIRASGSEVNEASREDVLTLAGCAEPSDDCLRQALGMLEVRAAVTGEVRPSAGGVEVELRHISPDGEPRSRTVSLAGSSPEEQTRTFRSEAEAFWRDEPSPAAAAAAAAATPEETPAGADLSGSSDRDEASFSASRVEPYAWGIAGAGVGLVVVGGILLIAADGKQGDVDDAPTDTVEDLENLVDLEASGRRYARWGNVCLIVGGVAAIAGGVLVFRQGRANGDRGGESPSPQITVAPTAGEGLGAALLVRGGF